MKPKKPLAWDPAKSTADNAREALPRLAEEFFAAGRKAVRKKKKPAALHRFRIKAKSFRYALEIFQPLYGPAFESRLGALKRIQQDLGEISDCATTRRLLDKAQLGGGFVGDELRQALDKKEKQRIRKLARHWKDTFDAPGEDEKWTRYLRDYAGRSKSTGG